MSYTHTRNIQTYLLTLLWQTPTDTYLLNNEKKMEMKIGEGLLETRKMIIWGGAVKGLREGNKEVNLIKVCYTHV